MLCMWVLFLCRKKGEKLGNPLDEDGNQTTHKAEPVYGLPIFFKLV